MIAASLVSTDINQVLRLTINGQGFFETTSQGLVLRGGDISHDPAGTGQNVYRRIYIQGCQTARQHNMPIQDTAHGIRDRFVKIISFDKYRIKPCDAPLGKITGPLQQLG